jgi:hypothetical protein
VPRRGGGEEITARLWRDTEFVPRKLRLLGPTEEVEEDFGADRDGGEDTTEDDDANSEVTVGNREGVANTAPGELKKVLA